MELAMLQGNVTGSFSTLERVPGLQLGQKRVVFLCSRMARPEFLAGCIGGAASEFFCFGKFAQTGEDARKIVTGVKRFDLIGTAELLGDAQNLAILGLRAGIISLVKESVSEPAA